MGVLVVLVVVELCRSIECMTNFRFPIALAVFVSNREVSLSENHQCSALKDHIMTDLGITRERARRKWCDSTLSALGNPVLREFGTGL